MGLGNDFESALQDTFSDIRKTRGALLFWLYPPVRPTGLRGKCPVFVMTGQSMFDIGGWRTVKTDCGDVAQAVGVEVKATGEPKPSLPIVGPEQQASGLQFHQLEALASLHRDGGLTGVVWNNGGSVGVLRGDAVEERFLTYLASMENEKRGGSIPRGSRSISWNHFNVVPDSGKLRDWFDILKKES